MSGAWLPTTDETHRRGAEDAETILETVRAPCLCDELGRCIGEHATVSKTY